MLAGLMPIEVEPVALVRDMGALQDACARARKRRGISQWELDQRSGVQNGYVGKLEAWRTPVYGRMLGSVSLPLVLEALGLALLVVEVRSVAPREPADDEAPEQLILPLRGGKINRRALTRHTSVNACQAA
jgi:hypothetical protein